MPFLPSQNSNDLVLGKITQPHPSTLSGKILRAISRPDYYVAHTHLRRHMYVVGMSGKGKSRFLEHCIISDIEAGRGVGLIDPHSDLARQTIARLYHRGWFSVPANRAKFIYVNPFDQSRCITPFNLLAASANPTRIEVHNLIRRQIGVFKRYWKDNLQSAPNFENNMSHALKLLICARRTILDYPSIFTPDTTFRDQLLAQVNDPVLDEFFKQRLAAFTKASAAERTDSSVNKTAPIRNDPFASVMHGQPDNWFTYRKWMDEGYVVFIDLGDGQDDDTREYFGNLFTYGFEKAASSRADIDPSLRREFYLYVDEFQDFSEASAKAFSRILSGARKFKLYLTLVNQYFGQLDDKKMLEAVFGNVGIKVFFGLSEFDAIGVSPALGLGHLDTQEIKHEAQTDTQHPVYESTADQEKQIAADVANQIVQKATVRDSTGAKISIESMPLPDIPQLPPDLFNQVVPPYGIPYQQALANIRPAQNPTQRMPDYDSLKAERIPADNNQRLRSLPYEEYLQTDHWKRTRRNALKRAKYRCQLCNEKGRLDVHHRTYENRGDEQKQDVIALCHSCHQKFHEVGEQPAEDKYAAPV